MAILAALIYLQFRTWRGFDWAAFWSQTGQVHMLNIIYALALNYLAYVLRAFRWKIFLRPVRENAKVIDLLAPTFIGFTGLAILGRPGELIRPYLIARKEDLPFSSQLAVWAVERIFDLGAFALLLLAAIFFAVGPRELAYYSRIRTGGFVLAGLVTILAVVAEVINLKGYAAADWIEKEFSHWPSKLAQRTALRIREFRSGLNAIHGVPSLIQLILASVLMWLTIALAFQQVTHSYTALELQIPISNVIVLMGSSIVGSLIQLPGVGGGSQLATIAALERVFNASHEVAASCGILLWLVTFVSVIPLGLLLAHKERLSFRKLSEVSQQETIDLTTSGAGGATKDDNFMSAA
ncbi:MAG: lysylphosphatidylglycerol synthase transmembrane domain-containing protein [Candidatus Acidiferrales bacterium]